MLSLEGDHAHLQSYSEWFETRPRTTPEDPGAALARLTEQLPPNEWLSARGLPASSLLLTALPILPAALRPVEWVKRETPIPAPPEDDWGYLYERYPAEVARAQRASQQRIFTHEPVARGINHRYQNIIKQNELLASCLRYEAPTLIILREYAALAHLIHSLFWVGKDSLLAYYCTKQDTAKEALALLGLSLVR